MPFNLDKARAFLEETRSYGIVFDRDSDGICSAALVVKYLRTKGIEPVLAKCKDEVGINVSDVLLDQMKEQERVITCDLPIDQSPMEPSLRGVKMLVLDHHIPRKDLSSRTVVHINPRFEDAKLYRPTSYLAYVLTQPFSTKYCWLAGVGVLSDYGLKDCKDLIDLVAKKHPELVLKELYDQREMWNSGLGLISNIISAAYGVEGHKGATLAFDVVSNAESPEDITSSALMKHYNAYQTELEATMDDFEHNAVRFEKAGALMYHIASKYKIVGVLATRVAEAHSDSVVMVWRATAHNVEMSFRCQSGRVDVAALVKELTRGLGEGGGHDKAAAGSVPIEHKEEFLERVRRKFEGLTV